MWHQGGSQGTFLSSGAVPAPCTGSIEPKPALSPLPKGLQCPSTHSCPPSPCLHSPANMRNPFRPGHLGLPVPLPASCHPAPCHLCPSVTLLHPGEAFPRLCPCSRSFRTGHTALAYFGLQPQKYLQADPVPYPGTLPLSPVCLCPLCPKLCPLTAWPCIAQYVFPCTSHLPGHFPQDAGERTEQYGTVIAEKRQKKGEGAKKKKTTKQGKCTYAK